MFNINGTDCPTPHETRAIKPFSGQTRTIEKNRKLRRQQIGFSAVVRLEPKHYETIIPIWKGEIGFDTKMNGDDIAYEMRDIRNHVFDTLLLVSNLTEFCPVI